MKKKFKSAKHAHEARVLAAEWEELLKAHQSKTFGSLNKKAVTPKAIDTVRKSQYIPSRVTPGGSTALPPAKVYTGTEMIGIGQLHKSNAIPVFRQDEAIELANMRR